MNDPDNQNAAGLPQIITPLESGYIKSLLPMIVPILNQVLDATNLDVLLHITPLTTNSAWKGIQAALTLLSIVLVVVKRLKEGRDPNSTAPRIVLRKPEPPDQLASISSYRGPEGSSVEITTYPTPEILRVESDPASPALTEQQLWEQVKARIAADRAAASQKAGPAAPVPPQATPSGLPGS